MTQDTGKVNRHLKHNHGGIANWINAPLLSIIVIVGRRLAPPEPATVGCYAYTIHIYIYIYTYVCIYIYIYIYTYTDIYVI